jgi:hypothetical protein
MQFRDWRRQPEPVTLDHERFLDIMSESKPSGGILFLGSGRAEL